jgi:aminoglycoside phosphotransferase (APT) family kinase protein
LSGAGSRITLGAPIESRWVRAEPRRDVALPVLERIVHRAFPGVKIVGVEPLEGMRNANFKIHFDGRAEPFVVRVYEHDRSLCRKELDLFQLIGKSIPIPEIIHAEPEGMDDIHPFAILEFVEGVTFRDLKCTRNLEAIGQAAFAVGQTLAALGRIMFPASGWLGPGPAVTAGLLEGLNPAPRFLDECLRSENLLTRIDRKVRDQLHELVWEHAGQFSEMDKSAHLVHCDFGKRNILVRQTEQEWVVAAVLDWEFAVSGSPLIDVGHFLRYERRSRPLVEPEFSRGFAEAGGELPADWRRLARLVDCLALCEALTRDDLPDEFAGELAELICATAEDRDPCHQ